MKVYNSNALTSLQLLRGNKLLVDLDQIFGIEEAKTLGLPPLVEEPISGPEDLVHSLIERQARKIPDTIAVQFEQNYSLTYRQLNETANAVARLLVCGRGTFVPIAVDRSINLVVALLAVLKTGAAYVLLSSDASIERNRFIVGDTHAPFVICDESTQGRFPGTTEVLIEDLVAQAQLMEPQYGRNLNTFQTPSDIAYIIYTSGTTGTPKGVLLSHGAAHCGLSALPIPSASQPLRQLLCHSPSFSAAQRTILGTLSRGGTLCLASKENLTLHLHDMVEEMGVSSLEITPSMLKLMNPSAVPECVKKITLGGEIVGPALVETWAARVELVSAYGLSECTQLNMRHKLSPGENPGVVGKPSDGTTVYILAPNSTTPLPPTEPGELCLGGPQLAEGYLNLPEKTRESFISNPFGAGRLYRTGDLVVAHEDGKIEMIGRIDQQTKIDGQRVEPNESNSIIQLQPDVIMSCVVSATVLNRKALVALVVPEKNREWRSLLREIRANLRNQLPSYAIPTYWVQRDHLPLNASGKVDVATLVKMVEKMGEQELITPSNTPPVTPPGTPPITHQVTSSVDWFEATVAEVVASVLSISLAVIDFEASFQELGGTSLDAIVAASKLRDLNINISVPDLLQSESLREATLRRADSTMNEMSSLAPFSLLPEDSNMNLTGLEDAYPVTPLQESVIADSMLGKANYVYQRVYKIQGMNPSQVRSAIEAVVARNTILRTSFVPWKRTFLQIVRKAVSIPWKTLRNKSLESYMLESASEEMPLDDPLVRAAVLNDSLLVVDMHHALFDFWSSQFIFADAISLLQGQDPISRTPFSTYVAYQQRKHDEAARNFWKTYLESSTPAVLDVLATKQLSSRQAPFAISSRVGAGLLEFSTNHGITLGTLLHAAWALTLSVQLQSSDVLFLTAFSGRDAEIDGILTLAGPTLCISPMRVHVDGSSSMLAFTKSVQKNLWTLSRYAHSGLRNALTAGNLRADTFNTMVNVLVKAKSFPEDSPLVPVLTHGDNFTQYVTIEIEEDDPTFVKLLVPSSTDHAQAQSLLESFVTILDSMVAKPDARISNQPWTEPLVQKQIPQKNTEITLAAEPRFGLAHTAFESFAATTPSKTAIRTSTGLTLSYGELNAKANSFAAWLKQQGVRHEEMIPLYMEKSAMTLISILGIIKAGASFTPLDMRNSHDRNAFIVKDVGASRIVTDKKNQEGCTAFCVELVIPEELELNSNADQPPVVPELTPDSVIYAIYTSGSTGLPKGVLVPHSAVTAATEGMIEATAVTSEWNALWVLNYVFDASYYDVFTIFSAGATLCLAPQDDLLSDLAGYINDMGIEQVMLTPTITKLISGGPAQVPSLKVLNVCGERIDVNILEWAKSVDVYNGYGPTEATILMTVSKVEPEGSLNSIGLPLKHVTAVVLPPDGGSLEPVPRGAIGELCVSGPQLAKGYLNRPEQTNAAFIRSKDGEPLYRTGDLARWANDGTIECLGRKDYQVKLNGFRIELGEIENAILRTGDANAVVVSVAEVQGKRQLVAFCILQGDHQPGKGGPLSPVDRLNKVSDLKSKLTTISHYMMPALFLPFGSFPTLPSGKANRKELVALVEKMQKSEITQYIPIDDEAAGEFQAVSTKEEHIMRQAWSMVLDEPEESIGASSIFLSLGGDSISAINVVAVCRKLSYSISVADILAHPTLAEQAKHLKSAKKQEPLQDIQYTTPSSVLSALGNANINVDQSIEEIYPCGPGQIEFLTQGHTRHQFWNLTACRELSEDFDIDRWLEVTRELTARNQILRTMYYQADPTDSGSWVQIVFKDPALNWEEVYYNTEVEKLRYMEELRDSLFNFGKPNIKYRLLHSLLDGSRTLCIKVDHGSYDGTLLRIFDEQFTAIARGEQDLAPVHSFKQFVDWIHRSDRNAALQYWVDSLKSYAPVHNLPLQPVTDRLKFAKVNADVDAVASRFGITASTVFQAAYSLVAGRLGGTTDVLVDNLITGRNADVENPQELNGTCANFLPFRSVLQGTDSIEEYLKNTQNTFWSTTEHGTVGLHDIYGALGRDRQVHSAKLLYCFQPFEPAPASAQQNNMRWIVMAQSKVFMTINYAVMVEIQKTLTGYRFKLQFDGRALSDAQADATLKLFDDVLNAMLKMDGRVKSLMSLPVADGLEGLWWEE
ncbi:MAG: NRPS [Peltula sp. TS41687]|nr:MAG: NRPS [Peltula sp. TS41687]